MKTKISLILLTLLSLTSMVFGQTGISTGQRYIDHRGDYVDFGNGLYISSGIFAGAPRHVTISLTAAQINGMSAAPVLLVQAPGSGHSLAVQKVIFAITRTSTAFASGGAAIIQYNSTATGGGTQACDSTLASTVITGSAGLSNSVRNGAVISDSSATDSQGLYISNATGAFTTGTGTAVVDVWYVVN